MGRRIKYKERLPVEGPLEEELPGSMRKPWGTDITKDPINNIVQPRGPMFKVWLVLQGCLEVLLDAVHETLLTVTNLQ